MRPTPDDYAEARRLLAPAVFGGTAADGLAADGHQHDHDEELGYYWVWRAGVGFDIRSCGGMPAMTMGTVTRRRQPPACDCLLFSYTS
jgi:hypothetical protein